MYYLTDKAVRTSHFHSFLFILNTAAGRALLLLLSLCWMTCYVHTFPPLCNRDTIARRNQKWVMTFSSSQQTVHHHHDG
ncbi:hypothetical protein BDB00DRAFT_805613 [Zychaea mexicana]|uniref:uncharacterized protein n=1 Tax=Zychaea mexicana TaxID=64656 RepID=UPI0022FEFF2E|nr:uncharacterized protein BDB00DRAFT_805613 [Zychaea mexicana]KAI9497235.1 hypothetical protein BDB00DRAFT_805613 [Zychaea mexicana]